MSRPYPQSPVSPVPPPQQAYPVWTTPPSTYSLVDLRAQIIANASILISLLNDPSVTADRLEVTTARFIPRAAQRPQHKYYAMLVKKPRPYLPDQRAQTLPSPRMQMLLKGKPLDSEQAAMEWMLWELEERMHALAQQKERVTEPEESCLLM